MKLISYWYKTAKEVIFQPKEFFLKMPTTGGYQEPMKFALVNIFVGSILSLVAFLLLTMSSLKLKFIEQVLQILGSDIVTIIWMLIPLELLLSSFSFMALWFLAVMILGAASIFVSAVIYHAALKIVGGKRDYEATFRIMAYASAFYVVTWVPIVNIFILFYAFYVIIVASEYVHKITLFRSILAIVPIRVATMMIGLIVTVIMYAITNVWTDMSGGIGPHVSPDMMPEPVKAVAGMLK
ncbi:MAG: YIP1 family protein [archaeon]